MYRLPYTQCVLLVAYGCNSDYKIYRPNSTTTVAKNKNAIADVSNVVLNGPYILNNMLKCANSRIY